MSNLKNKLVKDICKILDKLKSILIIIFPIDVFKKLKAKMIELSFIKDAKKIAYIKGAYPFGVNLIGNIKSQTGQGEECRLIAGAFSESTLPFLIIDAKIGIPFNHNDNKWDRKIVQTPKFSTNVFHINPPELPSLKQSLPEKTWDKRYNIGFWNCELTEIPDEWVSAFSLVDEIWASSHFCVEAIEKKSPVPVTFVPYGLSVASNPKFDRSYFNLPKDKFLFLTMFDSNSIIQRENPIGSIKAFKNAFLKEDLSVGIIIKINKPTEEILDTINAELEGYNNIYIIKNTLTKQEVNSLINIADVFVSLHKSEGFGLAIAEAMLLKTPVIASYWSANSDFMSVQTACCIDSSLVKIDKDYSMYKPGQLWANPDIIQASVFMKILKADSHYRKQLCDNAYEFMTSNYSIQKSAEIIKKRIYEINSNNS